MVPSKSFAPAEQIIKALITKDAKGVSPKNNVSIQREKFKKECIQAKGIILNDSFLLNLPKERMSINYPGKNRILAYCGIWGIAIHFDPVKGDYDFTISVLAGQKNLNGLRSFHFYRYDPEEIQKDIVRVCGQDTYEQWKQQAISDLESLRQLIYEVSKVIQRPITSVTCCKRSELLCKRVGLNVIDGYAVLPPH